MAVGVEHWEWLCWRSALGGSLERRLLGQRPYAALTVALPWRLVQGVSRRRPCVCGRRHPLMIFFNQGQYYLFVAPLTLLSAKS
jgi:hypothetical protein